MDGLLFFWIALCLGFIMLEAATPNLFFFFSGAIGALASMAGHWLGLEFWLQSLLFFITSACTLVAIKHALRRLPAFRTQHHQKTNSQLLIGKHGIVTHEIGATYRGYIKVNGQMWAAENSLREKIPTGESVEILAISGAHVKVKKLETLSEE